VPGGSFFVRSIRTREKKPPPLARRRPEHFLRNCDQ
jgi:hypothetical protein